MDNSSTSSNESTINLHVRSPRSPGSLKNHHAGSLPLYMFLSLDEKNVHDNCPKASNPYHKCTRVCIQRINRVIKQVVIDESKNTYSSTQVYPKCTNASNPYHKCTERCVQRMNEGKKSVLSDPTCESLGNSHMSSPESTGETKKSLPDRSSLHPKCPNVSNPYHKCTETCTQKINAGKKQIDGETSAVDASIPSHNSVENSYAKKPRNHPEALPLTMFISPDGRNVIHPNCPNASNPYHKCTERCIQRSNAEKKGSKGETSGPVNTSTPSHNIRKNVHQMCPNASNPYHTTCTETCMQRISNIGKKQNDEKVSEANMHPQCKYASNPYHKCAETCIQRKNTGKEKSKGESSVAIEEINKGKNMNKKATYMDSKCLDASDPNSLNSSEKSIDRMNSEKKKASEAAESAEKEEKSTEEEKGGNDINSEENDQVMKMLEKRYSSCTNASDSPHKCAVDNSLVEEAQARGEEMKEIVPSTEEIAEKPECLYALDPSLSSAKYCFREFTGDLVKGGGYSALQAEDNCFLKIDVQTYFLLYLVIIMSVLVAAGSK